MIEYGLQAVINRNTHLVKNLISTDMKKIYMKMLEITNVINLDT